MEHGLSVDVKIQDFGTCIIGPELPTAGIAPLSGITTGRSFTGFLWDGRCKSR